MIEAHHFNEIRNGKTVSVDGFVLIPIFTIDLDENDVNERLVSYDKVVENHREFPYFFSCTMAAFDDLSVCFFQIGQGSPKEFKEIIKFIKTSTTGLWCFVKNGTFTFSDSIDAAIVSSYLHS